MRKIISKIKIPRRFKTASGIISLALTAVFIGLAVMAYAAIDNADKNRANEAPEGTSPVSAVTGFDYGEPGFKLVAENDGFVLYADTTTAEVAVMDKATGTMWYTNPQDRAEDTVAPMKPLLAAQLVLTLSTSSRTNAVSSITINSTNDCLNNNGMSFEMIGGGIEFIYAFPRHGIIVNLQYTLTDGGLRVRVPEGGFNEAWPEKYYILNVDVLPYFGCGGPGDDGYLLLPDGSGTLIHFNNGKQRFSPVRTEIYGYDRAVAQTSAPAGNQPAHMPVFGIKNNDAAFLAVISEGEENAYVTGVTSMKLSSYNTVYSSAVCRTRAGTVTGSQPGGSSRATTITDFSENNYMDTGYAVEYLFLGGRDADYIGMAKRYRLHLLDEGRLNPVPGAASMPFVVDLYGGMNVRRKGWGTFINSLVRLTGYKEAETVVRDLKSRGVEDIVVNYIGALSGGQNGKLITEARYERRLGSRKDYNDLMEYLRLEGIPIYFEYEPILFYQSGNGYSFNSYAVRSFYKRYAFQYLYDRASLLPLEKGLAGYLLDADAIPGLTQKFFGAAQQYGIQNITLNSVGGFLYSNFSDSHRYTNTYTKGRYEDVMSDASSRFESLMVKGANAYTFAYADFITDVPITDSGFDMTDEGVPFYQYVFNGQIPLASTPINFGSDYRANFLAALETGCGIKFAFLYENAGALSNTGYDTLFSAQYDLWVDIAAEMYLELHAFSKTVEGRTIEGRRSLADGVVEVLYSGGLRAVFNYTGEAYDAGGAVITERGFAFIS